MSKLDKVLFFISVHQFFTWKQFIKYFDCQYPSTETNYLSMLVHSGYVELAFRGSYKSADKISCLTYEELRSEAYDPEYNSNSTVDDRERREDLGCSFCRPNKGENATRKGKHGKTKPKYKDKR